MLTITFALFMLGATGCDLFGGDDDSNNSSDTSRTLSVQMSYGNSNICPDVGPSDEVVFLLSYDDVQVEADINFGLPEILIIRPMDGQGLNVQVRDAASNELLRDRTVTIRTTNQDEEAEENGFSQRRDILYCHPPDIVFVGF
ncbi:MAG: hypothetical protein AAF624_15550 [Bacteroidota bacterium]